MASPAPEVEFVDLLSSDDEQQVVASVPPSKRLRRSPEACSPHASSSPAASSVSSQATVPQPTSLPLFASEGPSAAAGPLDQVQQDEVEPGLKPAPEGHAYSSGELDCNSFLGLSTQQIENLQAEDYLWWLSDHDELQLACCSQTQRDCSSADNSIPIRIVWDPHAKLLGPSQRHFASASKRIQLHFFPGQTVRWRHDDIIHEVSAQA